MSKGNGWINWNWRNCVRKCCPFRVIDNRNFSHVRRHIIEFSTSSVIQSRQSIPLDSTLTSSRKPLSPEDKSIVIRVPFASLCLYTTQAPVYRFASFCQNRSFINFQKNISKKRKICNQLYFEKYLLFGDWFPRNQFFIILRLC